MTRYEIMMQLNEHSQAAIQRARQMARGGAGNSDIQQATGLMPRQVYMLRQLEQQGEG